MPPRRILISAFSVSPIRGSESGVGWHLCSRLGQYHHLTVLYSPITHGEPHQTELESHLRSHGPPPNVTFHPVQPPTLMRLSERLQFHRHARPLFYLGYHAWQRHARDQALRLLQQQPFHLIHQLNMIGYREPGSLYDLGLPFIWGPVGGAPNLPWAFFPALSFRARAFYTFRNLSNSLQMRLSSRPKKAARAASIVFASTPENQHMISHLWNVPAQLLLETGTSPHPQSQPHHYNPARPLRVCWSGLHEGRKLLPILLHALASPPLADRIDLLILGAGPETPRWKHLAQSLNLSQRIQWLGKLPHDLAISQMAQSDLLAFTGIQEGTPHVVLEALSLGLPVICHDSCGMGIAVTSNCGIKIPVRDIPTSIRGFTHALSQFLTSPSLLFNLSAASLRRSDELSWDRKALELATLYDRLLATP